MGFQRFRSICSVGQNASGSDHGPVIAAHCRIAGGRGRQLRDSLVKSLLND